MQTETAKRPCGIGADDLRGLLANYGTAYANVLQYLDSEPLATPCGRDADDILRAEVRHAVREEMAQCLSDVVFRRTELGTAGDPGITALRICADVMRAELGWSSARTDDEVQRVRDRYAMTCVEITGANA